MKIRFFAALAAVSLLWSSQAGLAAEPAGAAAELKDLVTKVNAKLRAGQRTEKELADELKAFDASLARHQDEKTEDVARILYMKALLYLQVFGQTDPGNELMARVKREFPGTPAAQDADRQLVQSSLAEGKPFPDFAEKDVAGQPLSIARYQGKVVLIDFWATWCLPCVGEVPNVVRTYEKLHDQGFEVIGVSLDQDQAKLTAFTREKHMIWPQYFDGKGWGNKLAQRYGIASIPATFLLDGQGKIIARNLRGPALEAAVARALAAK